MPPAEAQGVDSANSLFYKKVMSNISPLFPWIHIQQSTFHRRASVPLSLQRGKYITSFGLPLCWDKGKHENVLSSFSLKGSPTDFQSDRLNHLIVCQLPSHEFCPFIISTILFKRSLVTGWVLWRRWERVILSVAPLLKTSRAR